MCVIYLLQYNSHQSTALLGGKGHDYSYLCLGLSRQKGVWHSPCTVNVTLAEGGRITDCASTSFAAPSRKFSVL